MVSCCVPGCGNRSGRKRKKPGVGMHGFPKDEPRRTHWVQAIQRENWVPKKTSQVCTEHFSDAHLNKTYRTGPVLREFAVPSIFPGRPGHSKVQKATGCDAGVSKADVSSMVDSKVGVRTAVANMANIAVTSDQGKKFSVQHWEIDRNKAIIELDANKVKPLAVDNDENLAGPTDTISETELPDGTVCEFYSLDLAEESTSNDAVGEIENDGPKIEAVFPIQVAEVPQDNDVMVEYIKSKRNQPSSYAKKRKASEDPLAQLDGIRPAKTRPGITAEVPQGGASSKNGDVEFEKILRALEQDQITLPSLCWSHTRLGQTILIFLCWSDDLKLKKKAVFCKGSQMSLFIGDQLLANGSTQDTKFDLEECLRLLDLFEQCKGLFGQNRTWSENCTKYLMLADGNESCSACRGVADILRTNSQNTGTPLLAATAPETTRVQQIVPNHEPQGLTALLNSTSNTSTTKSVAAGRLQATSEQKVEVQAKNVSNNSEYLVVDFVVSGDSVAPNIPPPPVPSVGLEPQKSTSENDTPRKSPLITPPRAKKILIVDDQTAGLPSENLQSRKAKMAESGRRCSLRKKPTARKSTGGPRMSVLPQSSKKRTDDSRKSEIKSLPSRASGEDDLLETIKEPTEVMVLSEAESLSPGSSKEAALTDGPSPEYSPLTSDVDDDLLKNREEAAKVMMMMRYEAKSRSPPTIIPEVEDDALGVTKVSNTSVNSTIDESDLQAPPTASSDGVKKEDPS